jgi:DNA-binding NarL/FixJ family response regulator
MGSRPTAPRNWKEGLLLRRYHFPPSGEKESDLATRIDYGGVGYFFPLGTPDQAVAAQKAKQIYEFVAKEGWAAANRVHSRELIIAFEWCLQPVLWTYTTIHTLLGDAPTTAQPTEITPPDAKRVLIVELDDGIRRALSWSINQEAGFASVTCSAVEDFRESIARHKPVFVIVNRNLAGRLGLDSPGSLALIQAGLPVVTYSAYADGDQMFVSTPGGAEGYLVKRVKPSSLLEPVSPASNLQKLALEALVTQVKTYFQKLVQATSAHDRSAISKLTQREQEVLALMSKGCVDKEIAQIMGISAWTVHGHIKNIFERLNVHTRTEAVVRYLEK